MNVLPEEHCAHRAQLGHNWDTWVTLGCLGQSMAGLL